MLSRKGFPQKWSAYIQFLKSDTYAMALKESKNIADNPTFQKVFQEFKRKYPWGRIDWNDPQTKERIKAYEKFGEKYGIIPGFLKNDGTVTRYFFSRIVEKPDILFSALISKGYIDANGKVQKKFNHLKKYTEMELPQGFGDYRKLIYEILRQAQMTVMVKHKVEIGSEIKDGRIVAVMRVREPLKWQTLKDYFNLMVWNTIDTFGEPKRDSGRREKITQNELIELRKMFDTMKANEAGLGYGNKDRLYAKLADNFNSSRLLEDRISVSYLKRLLNTKEHPTQYGFVPKSIFINTDPQGRGIFQELIRKNILIERTTGNIFLNRPLGKKINDLRLAKEIKRPKEIRGKNFDKIWKTLQQAPCYCDECWQSGPPSTLIK